MSGYLDLLTAAAPLVASGISAFGTAKTAQGYNEAGSAAIAAGNYNAQVDEIRAQNALAAAGANATMVQSRTRRTMGEIGAAYGAAGVDNQGTPLQVMQDAAIQGELSRQLTLYQGSITAQAARQQIPLDLYGAKNTADAYRIRAQSTLLTGAGNLLGPNGAGSSLLNFGNALSKFNFGGANPLTSGGSNMAGNFT